MHFLQFLCFRILFFFPLQCHKCLVDSGSVMFSHLSLFICFESLSSSVIFSWQLVHFSSRIICLTQICIIFFNLFNNLFRCESDLGVLSRWLSAGSIPGFFFSQQNYTRALQVTRYTLHPLSSTATLPCEPRCRKGEPGEDSTGIFIFLLNSTDRV